MTISITQEQAEAADNLEPEALAFDDMYMEQPTQFTMPEVITQQVTQIMCLQMGLRMIL